jgi:RimJ/RimL family protein N-acetyltransferase
MIRPENTASIRVAEKLGEQLEDRIEIYGAAALVYGISRERWQDTAG